ncbi:MAG: hypothetical protein ABW119_22130, partial [Candidatus Thiodiazotropha lotti]
LFGSAITLFSSTKSEPRHPYGIHCEIRGGETESQIDEVLQNWLDSGEAYEAFISTNVCRFNC